MTNHYAARLVASSTYDRCRAGATLVTMEVTFPRFILAEFNTHRVLTRNSASSRAVPTAKRIAAVSKHPFVPESFGQNRRGMTAGQALAGWRGLAAEAVWRASAKVACVSARALDALGTHKQHANRVLEPYMWHTVLVTADQWANFFNLRTDKNAQPEMQVIARLMRDLYHDAAVPQARVLGPGDMHLPLVDEAEAAALDRERALLVSAGRCARVSYLTHDGRRDVDADVALARSLMANGHMSPFEHQAWPGRHHPAGSYYKSNFTWDWVQYRKTLPGEAEWSPAAEGGLS